MLCEVHAASRRARAKIALTTFCSGVLLAMHLSVHRMFVCFVCCVYHDGTNCNPVVLNVLSLLMSKLLCGVHHVSCGVYLKSHMCHLSRHCHGSGVCVAMACVPCVCSCDVPARPLQKGCHWAAAAHSQPCAAPEPRLWHVCSLLCVVCLCVHVVVRVLRVG